MILLVGVNAKYIHSNLGIYCIDAYAKEHGMSEDELQIAEYTINQNIEDVLADIYLKRPELLAFSCYIWNIEYIEKISREISKVMPEVPIWFGGPEVSFDPGMQLQKYPWLKGVMCGEGEVTFFELASLYLQQLDKDTRNEDIDISVIQGITYRDGDKIISGHERVRMSMDDIPFPYTDMSNLQNRIVYYETSRGCPYGCSYCLSSVEKKVRFRSMELVRKELQFFIDNKVPQVKFVDRTFNCNHEHTMAIWQYIYEHDNGITNFHFELAADLLTDEEIEYVSRFRPGLVQFEIGVQTANPDTLKAIHRNPNLSVLRSKVALIRQKHNIHQHLDLIAGLPYEDYVSFKASFNEVYHMKPDQLQLGFLKVLKGSPIYFDRAEFGIVYQDYPPYEVMFTKWITYDDVLHLKRVEDMVERYYNSMQFEASVKYLVDLFETPFDFFEALGKFYHDNGYEGIHQSRMQNYEILFEFVNNLPDNMKGLISKDVLKQMLAFDLYARENLKNRPAFIERDNAVPDREWTRNFYMSEVSKSEYLQDYDRYDWKQIMRMTHLECFDYDMPAYISTGMLVEKKSIILFDYKNRNPLDNQSLYINIPVTV